MDRLCPLVCVVIAAACTPNTRIDDTPPTGTPPVGTPPIEAPLGEGPFMSGSSWWIPTNPWNSDLPCGSDDDPVPDVDIDDDGTADGFALGTSTTADNGKTVQLVCIAGEAHLIVNGKSVGKCPWLGGRNNVMTYYEDETCDGKIDDDDGNGHPDALGWTVLVSMDGPMPPIAGVSFGEHVLIDGRVVAVTAENYGKLTDQLGNPIDNDGDGLVDVTAYYYDGTEITKRHFEIDPATGDITEDPDGKVVFEPTHPWDVPDDRGANLPTLLANVSFANASLANATFVNASFANETFDANVSFDTNRLPHGMVVRTIEELQVAGASHTVGAELTNGLPIGVEATDEGLVFHFVALRGSGSIALRIDDDTRSARGWDEVATVLLDGHRVTHASREVAGAVLVEAEFSGQHSIGLEVRFSE